MKIGIVILNWNSFPLIVETISGLMKHEKTCNIYVIDNGSVDGSADQLEEKYPQITLIRSIVNTGFAVGNNIGIARALADGCDVVCLLNNDTIIDEPFINPCIRALELNPEVGIVGPVIVEGNKPDIIQCAGGSINRALLTFPYRAQGARYRREDKLVKVDYTLGAAMLVHRKVFESVPCLDQEYGLAYVEEADFCYRAKLAGYDTAIYHATRVRHLGGKSSGGRSNAFRRMCINRFVFGMKHSDAARFLFGSCYIVLRVLLNKLRKV